MANLPYVYSAATLVKMLGKIKIAAVPATFSQDFVSQTLLMKGGTARSVIPFIKKMGLVSDDGTPTDLYKQFRNNTKSASAIAECMRQLFAPLFAMNENVNTLSDSEIREMIVEATGSEKASKVTQLTLGTFKALNEIADYSSLPSSDTRMAAQETPHDQDDPLDATPGIPLETADLRRAEGMNLSYTINLNLPPTSDIEVFNAIFRSLRQHLLHQ